MEPTPPPPLIDVENPWLGLASYTEDAADFFHGRDKEAAELLRKVHGKTLTVLFGQSGLGKTSLLQAGLFPRLRSEGLLPVYIRLDWGTEAPGPREQILARLRTAFGAAGVEGGGQSAEGMAPGVPGPAEREKHAAPGGESLWEFFHRRERVLRLPGGRAVAPVLVLDQFEELFTLGRGNDASARALLTELGDLVENRPPASLEQRIEEGVVEAGDWDFGRRAYRVMVALREDYLPHLEPLRSAMPSLMQNRMRLTRMNGLQAQEVVLRPGRDLVSPEIGEKIVRFVAGGASETHTDLERLEIEPPLLSLICRELNSKRHALGQPLITEDLLAGNSDAILQDFYERCLGDQPPAVRAFVEDELLTDSGFRENMALERARKSLAQRGAPPEALDVLVDRRLLHIEERLNVPRIELTHDVLTGVVRASRDTRTQEETLQRGREQIARLHEEQRRARRRLRVAVAFCGVLAAVLLATVWGFFMEHSAYYRSFQKQYGFPKGIERISESEARHLPCSFLLTWKGLRWEHGLPQWNPPHRMLALNGHLIPTTKHSVGTYLWMPNSDSDDSSASAATADRAQQLGLSKACEWEFVADAKGEITYERAFDRNHRMIWGFVYSPSDSGAGTSRLARFVGPDGFPVMQRQSSAEIVKIDYDAHGFENRISYRDVLNQAALGPDGAFGRRYAYTAEGYELQLLSIDGKGAPMVDNSGNCGLLFHYDGHGLLREEDSVGPDLKLMATKSGWSEARYERDAFGRTTREAVFDSAGKPVLYGSGYHGWTAQYDEDGNQVTYTTLGLDGKPVNDSYGFATVRTTYDARGHSRQITYYDASGKPALHNSGNHGRLTEYDEFDNLVSQTWLGLDDKPMFLYGYTTYRAVVDSRGRNTRCTYLGLSGEPVLGVNGYHGWEMAYDERGNLVSQTYIGVDGKPVLSHGYAAFRSEFDARGREIRRTYYGVSGEPVVAKAGNHGWVAEYDERGNMASQTDIGLDGQPILTSGYATSRSEFDARGKVIRRTFYGVSGEPVLSGEGNHGLETGYDERGNKVSQANIGLDGRPTLVKGVAVHRSEFDAREREIRHTYYGVSGEPVQSAEGAYGWAAAYDERGNQVSQTWLGADGKPMLVKGLAIARSEYSVHGKETRCTFYGVSGEPALHTDGYHGWVAEYDERGNMVSQTDIGLDDKPVSVSGVATIHSVFDLLGREIRRTFYGVSGQPSLHKDGHHGWVAQYDEQGNKLSQTNLGLDDKPVLIGGVAIIRSAYDAFGRETRRAFHGVSDEPVLNADGVHGWVAEYDERGNMVSQTSIGLDGQPVLVKGIATVRSISDPIGKVTRRTYHGISGEPVLHTDGNHGWEASYDGHGNQTSMTWLGLDGKPMLLNGYATFRSVFDAQGREIRRTYHGLSGEPVLYKGGCHGWEAAYDAHGNQVLLTWLGLEDKPMLISGSATYRSQYDPDGRETRRTYYGVSGEPVLYKDGDHGWEAAYDARGNMESQTWLGLDGKPMLVDGFTTVRSVVDAAGNVTRRAYYGISGEPVLHKDGNHGWEAAYNAHGNQTSFTWLGLDEKPMLLKSYASYRSEFDARGKEIQRTYFGLTGQPLLYKEGYHGWRAHFDEHGSQTSLTWLGLDEKPMLINGFATYRSEFDARGKEIQRTYFGLTGQPALYKEGYHGWRSHFDERGNEVSSTWLGLDEKPMLISGSATYHSEFDARGKEVRRTYYGLSGEPVLRDDGYHGWEAAYDAEGRMTSESYFGLDGQPLRLVMAIQEVAPNTPAATQGIHPGDIILAYGKWSFFPERETGASWEALGAALQAGRNEAKTLLLWRDGNVLKLDFAPGSLGISDHRIAKPKEFIQELRSAYERERGGREG